MAMPIEGNPHMRFEGEIDLVPYNSIPGIADFSKPTTESDETLEDVLLKEAKADSFNHETWSEVRNYTKSFQPFKPYQEADVNPSFREAWNAAGGESSRLSNLVQKYKTTLKKSEIKLIMAYTYEGEPGKPKFYKELNEDFRNYDLMGGRFPYAKRVLRNALIELAKFQKKKGKNLPVVLYRWEPSCLVKKYRGQGDGWMHLNMFTSTSSREDFAHNKHNNVQVEFRKPETGAFIRDFSFFLDEDEVLLPPLHGKIKVIKASRFGSILQGPIL